MEATKRLYERDSYRKEFEARVERCVREDGHWNIVLDQTAFFPEGGGQGADQGWLGEAGVLDVQIRDGIIRHICDSPLKEGQTVKGRLCWKQRFSNMQQHTGEHIVSGIAHRTFGVNNVGFHLGSQDVTLDFDRLLKEEQIRWLEEQANEAVWANHRVEVSYPDEKILQKLEYRSKIDIEDQVRIVTIEDVDVCACCAPHVNNTGEIGLIKVTGWQKYKGGVRIHILCGDRALAAVCRDQRQISGISGLLSVKPEAVAEGVAHLQNECREAKYRVIELQTERMMDQILHLPQEQKNVCLFVSQLDVPVMRKAVNAMQEKHPGYCGIFVGNEDAGYRYLIVSKTLDSRKMGEALKQRFTCRGGGKADMIQGQITGRREEIERVFSSIEQENAAE